VKDIRAIVADMGLQLTDEQVADLDKRVREGYVTRNELEEKRSRITSLTEQVKALTEQVQGAGADAEKVKALQEQVAAFEEAERERKAREEEQEALREWVPALDQAIGDRRFANQVTEEAVRAKALAIHRANPDMGAEAVLATAVGDSDGIWANAQADPKGMPVPSDKSNQAALRDFAAQIFGRAK